jgi:hypothetical protein
MTLDQDIARLTAIGPVKDIQLRYCRGLDRLDWDLVPSCFHPDAVHDLGPFRGTVEQFVAWTSGVLTTFQSTTHFSGQQRVDLDGDTAWAEQNVRAYHRIPATNNEPAADWIMNLRYVDRMTCRDGDRQFPCDCAPANLPGPIPWSATPNWARSGAPKRGIAMPHPTREPDLEVSCWLGRTGDTPSRNLP